MKKIAKSILLAFLLIHLALTVQMAVAFAEGVNPVDTIIEIGNPTGLPDFYSNSAEHPDAPNNFTEPGVGTATSPIFFALDVFKFVVSGIAIVVIVIAALKLVSTANDEQATKMKDNLTAGIIGLLVIQIADVVVRKAIFGESGEAFESVSSAQDFGQESVSIFRGVIGFVEAFVGAVAVFTLVIRGFTLITGSGEEEELTKAKNHIIYALVGLAAVAISEVVVRGVVFPENGQSLPDVNKGKYILIELANFMSGFIAILSFAILFYGGYKYVTSGGNEEENEKLKKLFIGAAIALVLSLGAFALVNTLVEFDPGPLDEESSTELPGVTEEVVN